MKTLANLAITAIALFVLTDCAGSYVDAPNEEQASNVMPVSAPGEISPIDAVKIANKVLGNNTTRGANSIPSFQYVVNDKSTRSNASGDTIAYILNYPGNEGFAIISTSSKINPVLGF